MTVKIAIVDDSPLVLDAIQAAGEAAGYEVVTFDRSVGASAFVIRERPDVLLLDVSMPALDGNKICNLLKENANTRNTPVVLYSDRPASELATLSEACGADGYLRKNEDVDDTIRQLKPFLIGR